MGPDDALRADRSADGDRAACRVDSRRSRELDELNWVFFGATACAPDGPC